MVGKELKSLVKSLIEADNRAKIFYITSKCLDLLTKEVGLEIIKSECRIFGFYVIHVVDDISGPLKEEIWL